MTLVCKASAFFAIGTVLGACLGCDADRSAEGAPTARAVSTITLAVEGVTCAPSAAAVRAALRRLDGVRDARVSVDQKRAVVDYEAVKVTPPQMVEAVKRLGYQASLTPEAS